MAQQNLTAIILEHRDYRERDRLYALFTREVGKIVVRGSGARKSGAKLAPHLEPLMMTHVVIAKNRGRGTITFALCEESFHHMRARQCALQCARKSSTIVKRLLRDEDPHESVYSLLLIYLRTMDALAQHGASDIILRTVTQGFLFHALARLGWHVEMRTCVRCRRVMQKSATYTYFLRDGGFVCVDCLSNTRMRREDCIALSRDAAAALHIFGTNSIPSLAKLTMPQDVCVELEAFSDTRIAWIL